MSCMFHIGQPVKEAKPCKTMPSNMAKARRASRSWNLVLSKLLAGNGHLGVFHLKPRVGYDCDNGDEIHFYLMVFSGRRVSWNHSEELS